MNMQHSIIMFNIKIDYASMQYIKRNRKIFSCNKINIIKIKS